MRWKSKSHVVARRSTRTAAARTRFSALPAAQVLATILAAGGCSQSKPPPPESIPFPVAAAQRVAVAPVLNFSGEPAFDPVVASDLLASELTQLGDVTVIPVNRVVAALLRSETPHIRSPEHALDICRAVGSDAILVPAITEFSPYPPMTVALTMELYVLPELVTTVEDDLSSGPLRQMQRVYDASHHATVARVRQYADTRSTDVGPVEWRRCLLTQDRYLRFCFHEGLRELFLGESVRMVVAQTSDEEE